MRLPWAKRAPEVDPDLLIVIDEQTWQERSVIAQDELQVSDGARSFPKASLSRYWDETGRVVWVANAPRETLIKAEALDEVRQSNILRNVFAYQKPLPNPNYVIYIGLILVIIIAIWRR